MIWKLKKLLALLCCFVCSLLVGSSILSTEVKAIEFNTPVQYIETVSGAVITGYQVNGTWVSQSVNSLVVGESSNPVWVNALTIGLGTTWWITSGSGDVLNVSITLSNYTRSGVNLDTLSSVTSGNCSDYYILDYKVQELSDQTSVINLMLKPSYTGRNVTSFSIINNPGSGCSAKSWIYLWPDSRLTVNYVGHYRITDPSASNQSIVNAINTQSQNLQNIVNEQKNTTNAINNNTNAINNINEQQTQAGQQAQQDGNNAGSNSQQQAQQGGQTLLQGFSSFVGALTSASASDCVINGNIGDFKMGDMDLCQLSPPPVFQAISSIMVIGFVVPLSIATIRKFIGMFRSFQNG